MGKWFKQFEALIWVGTLIAVSLIWAYQSFATIAYVDQRHAGVMDVLSDIRDRVKSIDERTFDLAKGNK